MSLKLYLYTSFFSVPNNYKLKYTTFDVTIHFLFKRK